jgi:hypothetical protein
MVETIRRSEAMQFIESGRPFTLEFVTADVKRGTGGELIKVVNWQKVHGSKVDSKENAKGTSGATSDSTSHNPNHYQHKTFNIFNPANRQLHPHKVHFRLLISLNGKRIING